VAKSYDFEALRGAKSPSLSSSGNSFPGAPFGDSGAHVSRKTMLTIRKLAFLVAGVFFLALLMLKQSPSSPSIIRNRPHRNPYVEDPSQKSSTGKTKDEIERILQKTRRPSKSAEEFATLRDHLEFLYPYEGPAGTKFPAYIWQTWKFTPAMGEFDERFRMTEASWTERHPDYVHEVRFLSVWLTAGLD
jgi:alpha 1,6-mannosyltransferase